MKRKIGICVAVMVSVLAVLASCTVRPGGGSTGGGGSIEGGGSTGGGGAGIAPQVLAECRIAVDNADSFGIYSKETDTQPTDTEAAKKNYFVVFDEQGNMQDVVFLKENDETLTQEEIAGQIDKLYVARHFIYVRFTAFQVADDERRWDEDFDKKDYLCNEYLQSFAIDTATGKVYSLEGAKTIDLVGDSYIVSDDIYYRPAIENGNLTLTPYVSNPNIGVIDIFEDKYGTVFVRNSTTTETVGDVVYYQSDDLFLGDTPCYIPGDDGVMYVLTGKNGSSARPLIKSYDAARRLNTIGNDVTAALLRQDELYQYLIQNDLFYEFSSLSATAYHREGENYVIACSQYDARFITAGGALFGVKKDGSLCHYRAAIQDTGYGEEYRMVETSIGIRPSKLEPMGAYLVATVETLDGTLKYKVYMNGATPVKELLEEQTYDEGLITIMPMN